MTSTKLYASVGSGFNYRFSVENGSNSLAYILKAILNIKLPEITLANVNASYPATACVAGSYDVTFPLLNDGAAAAFNALPGTATALPALNTAPFTVNGTTIATGSAIVAGPIATTAGDLVTYRFCYSACAPIYSVTFASANGINNCPKCRSSAACTPSQCGKTIFIIYPDVCITPVYPVPAAAIVSTVTGATLYPGYLGNNAAANPNPTPAPAFNGLVVPGYDPLTGIPLPGAGYGSVTAILDSLPGGTGPVIPGAATALCPPFANGPSCCGGQNAFTTASACTIAPPTLTAGVPYYSVVDGVGTVIPATGTPLTSIAPPYATLPLGSYEFLTGSGYSLLAPTNASPASVFPVQTYNTVDLVSAIAMVGAANNMCKCQFIPNPGCLPAGGCSTGGCGPAACPPGSQFTGPTPGCLTNVPSIQPGNAYPVVDRVEPIVLQYPRNRVRWSRRAIMHMINKARFSAGCYSDNLDATAMSAALNYVPDKNGAREEFISAIGDFNDPFYEPRYSAEGSAAQTTIPSKNVDVILPFGSSRDIAVAFPAFAVNSQPTYNVELNNPSLLVKFEREIIQPVIVPPNSIGFSPVFAPSALNCNPQLLPATANGSACVPAANIPCPVAPFGLPMQCSPIGKPGTGLRTGRFVPVSKYPDQSAACPPITGPFIPVRSEGEYRQFVSNFDALSACFPVPSLTVLGAAITQQQYNDTLPSNSGKSIVYVTEVYAPIGRFKLAVNDSTDISLANVPGQTKAVFGRVVNATSAFVGDWNNGTTNGVDSEDETALPIVESVCGTANQRSLFPPNSWDYYNKTFAVACYGNRAIDDNTCAFSFTPDLSSLSQRASKNLRNVNASLSYKTRGPTHVIYDYILSAPIPVVGCNGIETCVTVPILTSGLSACTNCPSVYIPASYRGVQPGSGGGVITITPTSCNYEDGRSVVDGQCQKPQASCFGCQPNEIVTGERGTVINAPSDTACEYFLDLVQLKWEIVVVDASGNIHCANETNDDSLKCNCGNRTCPQNIQLAQSSAPQQLTAASMAGQGRYAIQQAAQTTNAAFTTTAQRQQGQAPVMRLQQVAGGCTSCAGRR